MILGFRRDVHKIYALLGYYEGYSDNYLPTFRENISVPKRRYRIDAVRCGISQKTENLKSEEIYKTRNTIPTQRAALYWCLLLFDERIRENI